MARKNYLCIIKNQINNIIKSRNNMIKKRYTKRVSIHYYNGTYSLTGDAWIGGNAKVSQSLL